MSLTTFTTAYHQPGILRKMRTRVETLAAFIQVMKLVVVHSVEKYKFYSHFKNILWKQLSTCHVRMYVPNLVRNEIIFLNFYEMNMRVNFFIFTLCTSCHQFIYEGKWLFFGLFEVVSCTLLRDISGIQCRKNTIFTNNICTYQSMKLK